MSLFSSIVNVVYTTARLLSGEEVDDCRNATDPTCTTGVAAVDAYARKLPEPTLVLPAADLRSPFVQMHPLSWSVNRLVMNDLLNWHTFIADPYILTQSSTGRDLSDLQTHAFPLILSNVVVSPKNPWALYHRHIYFDQETGLALIAIIDDGELLNVPQIPTAKTLLDYVHKLNTENGCNSSTSVFDTFVGNVTDPSGTSQVAGSLPLELNPTCWIPIVVYDTSNSGEMRPLRDFMSAIVDHPHPPAVIIDVLGLAADQPIFQAPRLLRNNVTWIASHRIDENEFFQVRATRSEDVSDPKQFANVEVLVTPLKELPNDMKDEIYDANVQKLWEQVQFAALNDPIVGYTTFMPVNREGDYRRCKAGECEIGNLITDAYRWAGQTDIAFTNSGGFRGSGWPEGPVRVSNIWDSWPFVNTLCKGTMSGISLFELISFSVSRATFEGSTTSSGNDMLQLSGVRMTYNTLLPADGERLVGLDVWNEAAGDYEPVDRTKLYTFATDSFNCDSNAEYPRLTGDDLVLPGEVPGFVYDAPTSQEMAIEYLQQYDGIYDASIEGRFVNDTEALVPLNLVESEDDCGLVTYWDADKQSCLPCPSSQLLVWKMNTVELKGTTGSPELIEAANTVVNNLDVPALLRPRASPNFVRLEKTGAALLAGTQTWRLLPGEALELPIVASAELLEPGTAQGSVSLNVALEDAFAGCVGGDVSFQVLMRVESDVDLNQLGAYAIIGYLLAALAMLVAVMFAAWTTKHRKTVVVNSMQPIFLITMCFGVIVMASSIIPMGLDDGVLSNSGCDKACMSIPWLLGLGGSISFSALFSKLWRINKIIQAGERLQRKRVRERDVLGPFVVIFMLNFALLLAWTLVDPLRWERQFVDGQPWNQYGICAQGNTGTVFLVLVGLVNGIALILTLWEAYRARHISDEFSESKSLGVAVYSWVQLFLVGTPVLVLIDRDEPVVRYVLQVLLIFAVCMSMLLLIFVPTINQARRFQYESPHSGSQERRRSMHVSGTGVPLHQGNSSLHFQVGGSEHFQARPGISDNHSSFGVLENVPSTFEDNLRSSGSRHREALSDQLFGGSIIADRATNDDDLIQVLAEASHESESQKNDEDSIEFPAYEET